MLPRHMEPTCCLLVETEQETACEEDEDEDEMLQAALQLSLLEK